MPCLSFNCCLCGGKICPCICIVLLVGVLGVQVLYCLLSLRCGDRISKKGGLCVTGDNPIVGFSVRSCYCQRPRNSSLSFASFLSWLANCHLIVIVAGTLSSERMVFFSSLLEIFAVASFPSPPSPRSSSPPPYPRARVAAANPATPSHIHAKSGG